MSDSEPLHEPTLEGVIFKVLPEIDKQLAARGIPVPGRKWPATDLLVKYVIVKFEGEDKSDFLNSYGFGFVLRIVGAWYQSTYGERAWRTFRDELSGLVKIRQELYLIIFPHLVRIDDDAQGHMRLKYSDCLEEQENAFDFIVDPPPLEQLNDTGQYQIKEEIGDLVSSIRRLWLGLALLDGPDVEVERLSSALAAEICRAPGYIAPFAGRDLGSFLLSLRLCCELALKLAVLQKNGKFDEIHNFDKLCIQISNDDHDTFNEGVCRELWDYRALCELRYGKEISMSVANAWDLYRRTIKFLLTFTSRLSRRGRMNGAIAILRQPIWSKAEYDLECIDSHTNAGES